MDHGVAARCQPRHRMHCHLIPGHEAVPRSADLCQVGACDALRSFRAIQLVLLSPTPLTCNDRRSGTRHRVAGCAMICEASAARCHERCSNIRNAAVAFGGECSATFLPRFARPAPLICSSRASCSRYTGLLTHRYCATPLPRRQVAALPLPHARVWTNMAAPVAEACPRCKHHHGHVSTIVYVTGDFLVRRSSSQRIPPSNPRVTPPWVQVDKCKTCGHYGRSVIFPGPGVCIVAAGLRRLCQVTRSSSAGLRERDSV
jgi:hypothetical protein